jgi:DNA polymerase III alpha subunit
LSDLVKSVGFVHLHVHSAYSLREGALTIEQLAKRAKADDMPALAITDTNNLFGALEFSEKLAKEGIQPIVGALSRPRRPARRCVRAKRGRARRSCCSPRARRAISA